FLFVTVGGRSGGLLMFGSDTVFFAVVVRCSGDGFGGVVWSVAVTVVVLAVFVAHCVISGGG
ncbi:hypothetical protein A2U01_0052808, partial [Trifolium medium]|nr:hypothetical protein [Trifolium medium]